MARNRKVCLLPWNPDHRLNTQRKANAVQICTMIHCTWTPSLIKVYCAAGQSSLHTVPHWIFMMKTQWVSASSFYRWGNWRSEEQLTCPGSYREGAKEPDFEPRSLNPSPDSSQAPEAASLVRKPGWVPCMGAPPNSRLFIHLQGQNTPSRKWKPKEQFLNQL